MLIAAPSPYALASERLRENGYHPMPVQPGTKIPGHVSGGVWRPMSRWQDFCAEMPADAVHGEWMRLAGAGVCMAHGVVVGVDLDTEREDVARAIFEALPQSPVKRRGKKGWMAYYRPAPDLAELNLGARVSWFSRDEERVLELLMHGTQSVLPPTIHPDTGKPYYWITEETLEDTPLDALPLLRKEDYNRLDLRLLTIGCTTRAPKKNHKPGVAAAAPEPFVSTGAHDLEKPFGRSLNDRALEPKAMARWWPALNLPKSKERSPGAWEGIAFWRSSGSGRALMERNPNLRATTRGIRDFGDDKSYTPIDLVMAARSCSISSAAEWLSQFVRPEEIGRHEEDEEPDHPVCAYDPDDEIVPEASPAPRGTWADMPKFSGRRGQILAAPITIPSEAEYRTLIPQDAGPFPIQNPASDCPGLLGLVAGYIDAASVTATEAGGLAVALPLLGALMGRRYETETALRTNIYTVALGGSGAGKTSLVSPAKELMMEAKKEKWIGQDRIASGPGLLKMLNGEIPKVCFLDEFGHMLKQIGSPGAGIHAQAIIKEFTALYSAANTIFAGTAMAMAEPVTIDSPHLCLFGMATPGQFWDAFGSSSMDDGSVARYMVFPIGESAPKQPDKACQSEVLEALGMLEAAFTAHPVTGNMGKRAVVMAPTEPSSEAARRKLIATMTGCARRAEELGVKGAPSILMRVAENAMKIALISAVGRNAARPLINQHDFEIGHALARWSATSMINNIASHIADNQYERDVNAVARFIQEAGETGRLWRELQRKFRSIKKRDLVEIVEGLEREETIGVITTPSERGGHPTKRLVRLLH